MCAPSSVSLTPSTDVRRMNVALTRAKASLFVLGNAPTLERSDDIWRKIVDNARSRSCLVKVSSLQPTCSVKCISLN